jgi:hypothetical protein
MAGNFAGIWQTGSGRQDFAVDLSFDDFAARYQAVTADGATSGLRLASFRTYLDGGQRRWAGVWREGTGQQLFAADLTWDAFVAQHQAAQQAGRWIELLQTYQDVGPRLYAAYWREGGTKQLVTADMTWGDFSAKYTEAKDSGLRLVCFQTYLDQAQRLWLGAWREGDGPHLLAADLDQTGFLAKDQEVTPQGVRLRHFQGYQDGGSTLWAGAWRAGQAADQDLFLQGASASDFKSRHDANAARGLRLVDLEVLPAPLLAGPTVRLRLKLVVGRESLAVSPELMIQRMREVYGNVGINVDVGGIDPLNLPAFLDVNVGDCNLGEPTGAIQELFDFRDGARDREVIVYLVRSTIKPFNGCAAHPPDRPGAVVASLASQWTLAHEVGHVLGLEHVEDNHNLMTGGGTDNVIPPPILTQDQVDIMLSNALIVRN